MLLVKSESSKNETYKTHGNITVHRLSEECSNDQDLTQLMGKIDTHRGILLSSNYEFPGRYSLWDIGFINPPLYISCKGLNFSIEALNFRGEILLPKIFSSLKSLPIISEFVSSSKNISGSIVDSNDYFSEEERSKKPSIFSILRIIIDLFRSSEDKHLGLYGAFGYDLAYQFESIEPILERHEDQRDLVLYLPDEIFVIDHSKSLTFRYEYDFEFDGASTLGLERTGIIDSFVFNDKKIKYSCDHRPGQFAECVRQSKEAFRKGDLFEVVPGKTFYEPINTLPSKIFSHLLKKNQSPYACFMNLGKQEYLVGASPEMYVRVSGKRVETCPISGTIARGKDAIEDSEKILELLNSKKDESELTMCTDVDRNDKSRICIPGTVKVIGRRQIEMYSKVIHTVDHIEGQLDENFDGIDAFLTHMWAVTVTGAPKIWAMQFLEKIERSARRWYGGAIGKLGFNGDVNTGMTLRTIRISEGTAEIRAGATLLYDSDPELEDEETVMKASAFIDAVKHSHESNSFSVENSINFSSSGIGKRIVIIDHQDSFVHTLGSYFKQTGADVVTYRFDVDHQRLLDISPNLIVLSPGPGCPNDFNLARTIKMALDLNAGIFGVCLGLQGIVEYYGGELGTLKYPMHGKNSTIKVSGGKLFSGLPNQFSAGRYHSLYGLNEKMPDVLDVVAESLDGVVMAVEHKSLAVSAVQFHPESILTLEGNIGLKIIQNAVTYLT
jgi:anthranilate synthase